MNTTQSFAGAAAWLGGYFTLWTIALVLLRTIGGFGSGEVIAALVIFGLLFPALALAVTRRTEPLPCVVRRPGTEIATLLVYLVAIAWLLVSGFGWIGRIASEPQHWIVLLAVKLAGFVAIPAALIWAAGHYRIGELAPVSFQRRHLLPALWMSLLFLVVQCFLGNGLRTIQSAHLPAWLIALAAPLTFAWLVVEAGVVEEFFFRVLLQQRLTAFLRTPWGGLVVSSLLFGLVHAPGFYLRPAATQEALGPHPSLLFAVAYSIALTSLAGLAMGILWMRTRNFAVVVLVHAAGDLLPTLAPWVKAFHLVR